ncbi:DgyrCDS6682 [Dimorphilus gyrociliatus]|uniref:DgyrCDS6682 n=1 Tax=Dimorphilus gyrociliatus TaxID=2664684 RepID=A0A7I8VNS7_9ANNE|nr:DgyrCDS6682 [Dimorphilus gyrociliatus]
MSEIENEEALLGEHDDGDEVPEESLTLDENETLDNEDDVDYTFGEEENGEENETNDGNEEDGTTEESDLETIKARVKEMEEEAKKLAEMQNEVEKQMNMTNQSIGSPTASSTEDKIEADSRSIYVGNVDYAATAEELEAHFHGCGAIQRVTIMCDKFSGHPKGFAYIEFGDKDAVNTAQALDDSLFRGRQIKVGPKRTNKPGMCTTNRPPRGMRFRGRGRGFFGFTQRRPFRGAGRSV